MIPRLCLTPAERQRAAAALQRYLEDRSSIVKTFALQGLADLSQNDPILRAKVKTTPRRSRPLRHASYARQSPEAFEKASTLAKYFPRHSHLSYTASPS